MDYALSNPSSRSRSHICRSVLSYKPSMAYANNVYINLIGILLFLPLFHSVNKSLCTDLSPKYFSIERLEPTNAFLGIEYNTMESLLSLDFTEKLKSNSTLACMKKCDEDKKCRKKIRKHYIGVLLNFSLGSELAETHIKISKKHFINYVDRFRSTWSTSTKALFISSCLSFCNMLYQSERTKEYKCMCPNPCDIQTVCDKKNCTQQGIFDHQFICACPEKYTFSQLVYMCIKDELETLRTNATVRRRLSDPDKCDDSPECDKDGTAFCHYIPRMKSTVCMCKAHREGKFCDKDVNACINHIRHPTLPNGGVQAVGHKACNVNYKGNECFSHITAEGDVYYRCRCNGQPWIPDPKLPYDNCLKKRTLCESSICINGKCITSEKGVIAHCICSPGYSGNSCERWVGEWTEWSPWDKCRPFCGDVRYTVRTRDCPTMEMVVRAKKECPGAAIEYAQCAQHPCARVEGSFMDSYFSIRQDALAATMSNAAICCAIITFTWFFFFWNIISDVVRRVIKRWNRKIAGRGARKDRHFSATASQQ